MANATVTRNTLVEALNQEVGLSRNECAELLEDFLRAITDGLAKGTTIRITPDTTCTTGMLPEPNG